MTVQKLACIALLACLALARLPACLALLIGFQSGRWSSSGTFFFVFDFFVCCAVCVFFGFALLRLLVGGVASKMRSTQTALYIGSGYQERMSPRDHDKTFSASDATGATAEVAYKKRPFGILRCSPKETMFRDLVIEIIPKSRHQEGAGQDIKWPQMKEDICEGFTR
ncbi:unnamed protein product [Polarella glacialis]|uniref:Uncharacterized protein n=1 Tax=Polarella glacialis TaxID=89957 RepID=A0A813FCH7_POLGL|nr:unnamed protein product [Polarella glacialis]